MTLPLILADQRIAEPRGIKAAIFGKSGVGKTSLLWSLNPDSTLFFDLEAGDLAIEGWGGDTIRPRTWEECRDFAVFIGGPNPAIRDGRPYGQRHYDEAVAKFGDPTVLNKYMSVFVDSITVAGRLCFQWAKDQPEAFSEKTGKPDVRGAYTTLQFAEKFENTRGLGGKDTIRDRISVLATKGYVKFLRDGSPFGFPITTSRFGYVCAERMVAPSCEEQTDPQTGEVTQLLIPVVPSVIKCPNTGIPLPDDNPDLWVNEEDPE